MAQTPEGRVKMRVKKVLDASHAYYFMPVSNGMGRHGIPDIICCVNGYFIGIECKAGNGKTTALQDRELENIKKAGGVSMVVNDKEETMTALMRVVQELQDA